MVCVCLFPLGEGGYMQCALGFFCLQSFLLCNCFTSHFVTAPCEESMGIQHVHIISLDIITDYLVEAMFTSDQKMWQEPGTLAYCSFICII